MINKIIFNFIEVRDFLLFLCTSDMIAMMIALVLWGIIIGVPALFIFFVIKDIIN